MTVKGKRGCFYALYYKLLQICFDHWYIPQFQRYGIDVLINSVCTGTEEFFPYW